MSARCCGGGNAIDVADTALDACEEENQDLGHRAVPNSLDAVFILG